MGQSKQQHDVLILDVSDRSSTSTDFSTDVCNVREGNPGRIAITLGKASSEAHTANTDVLEEGQKEEEEYSLSSDPEIHSIPGLTSSIKSLCGYVRLIVSLLSMLCYAMHLQGYLVLQTDSLGYARTCFANAMLSTFVPCPSQNAKADQRNATGTTARASLA